MDDNWTSPTHENESKDHYDVELVISKEMSTTSSISRQAANQQRTSSNQSHVIAGDAGYPSRKKTVIHPNWFRKRKAKRKKGHDVENTLEVFVEVGLASVVGNNVHDIYEVTRCFI